VLSAMAAGARSGALFKSGAAPEELARVTTLACDKTGTLTRGEMEPVAVTAVEGAEAAARARAAGLGRDSEPRIAQADTRARPGRAPEVADVQAVRGKGSRGVPDDEVVWAGTRRLGAEHDAPIAPGVEERLAELENEGVTPIILGRE